MNDLHIPVGLGPKWCGEQTRQLPGERGWNQCLRRHWRGTEALRQPRLHQGCSRHGGIAEDSVGMAHAGRRRRDQVVGKACFQLRGRLKRARGAEHDRVGSPRDGQSVLVEGVGDADAWQCVDEILGRGEGDAKLIAVLWPRTR